MYHFRAKPISWVQGSSQSSSTENSSWSRRASQVISVLICRFSEAKFYELNVSFQRLKRHKLCVTRLISLMAQIFPLSEIKQDQTPRLIWSCCNILDFSGHQRFNGRIVGTEKRGKAPRGSRLTPCLRAQGGGRLKAKGSRGNALAGQWQEGRWTVSTQKDEGSRAGLVSLIPELFGGISE